MSTVTPAMIYRAYVHWYIKHSWCTLDDVVRDMASYVQFDELMAKLRWLIESDRFRPGDVPPLLMPDDPVLLEAAFKLDCAFKDGSGAGYKDTSGISYEEYLRGAQARNDAHDGGRRKLLKAKIPGAKAGEH